MRKLHLFVVLLAAAAIPVHAQSTTNTNCQVNGSQVNCTSNTIGSANSTTNTNCNANGNQINCTSNTLGDSTSDAAEAERQREMYQSSQAAGAAVGGFVLKHRINSFCKKNPGGWVQPQGYSRIECSNWNAVHQTGSSKPVQASFPSQSSPTLTAAEIYAVEIYEGA
jgi:hypothetical protein